jgi:pyrimidine operon attenuation protein / uracil phosphoribosyltransferase
MDKVLLLNPKAFDITITRLCHELIENHNDFSSSAIIGLQPRGTFLAKRICTELKKILGVNDIKIGSLDVTFFRDDIRRKDPIIPSSTQIDFLVEKRKVILVDDVLFTGRTIRSGLDAMLAFGRPEKVELLVLIDRRYSRHLPIQADYVGKEVDSINSERVKVEWKETEGEDKVWLLRNTENKS